MPDLFEEKLRAEIIFNKLLACWEIEKLQEEIRRRQQILDALQTGEDYREEVRSCPA